jgi:hypothetical protein
MAADWQQLTRFLTELNVPVGSRVALPVAHLTDVIGDWPNMANVPDYWSPQMSHPAARLSLLKTRASRFSWGLRSDSLLTRHDEMALDRRWDTAVSGSHAP